MSWAGLGCQIRTEFLGVYFILFFVCLTADFYVCFIFT